MDQATWDALSDLDERNLCPACGKDDLADASLKITYKVYKHEEQFAHIERECSRCGYKWKEKPLFLTS